MRKIIKKQKGISLVIAITTMTLLLSISLSISSIVLRQIKINTLNDSSKPAFYAADSAIECAFYYDVSFVPDLNDPNLNINDNYSTSVFGPDIDHFGEPDAQEFLNDHKVRCGEAQGFGIIFNANKDTTNPNKVVTTFDIDYGDMCSKVEVIKTEVDTQITARGYNTKMVPNELGNYNCDLSDADSRRIVERGLTIKY